MLDIKLIEDILEHLYRVINFLEDLMVTDSPKYNKSEVEYEIKRLYVVESFLVSMMHDFINLDN